MFRFHEKYQRTDLKSRTNTKQTASFWIDANQRERENLKSSQRKGRTMIKKKVLNIHQK